VSSSPNLGAEASSGIGFREFIALMAMLTALVALSIDMILPALPAIGESLGVERANDNQLVVSLLFLGFGAGQFLYGPLSDTTGRKAAACFGLGLYLVGTILALAARSLPMMLAARLLQGVGVAGPRAVTLALVRDKFEGAAMARVMSLVMAVFILVPVVAPALGQVVLAASGWRAIFVVYLVMAIVAGGWFVVRQEETLPPERRIPFSLPRVLSAAREAATTRSTVGYTLAAGAVFGAFLAYLTMAQQILQQQYDLGSRFAIYFAVLATSLGVASLLNAALVGRMGMHRLSTWALRSICACSAVFAALAMQTDGQPPLWALMTYLMATFLGIGLLFGNLNALAMQPLGHIAGMGSAVVGGASMLVSLTLATAIGQSYNGTVVPLVVGFAVLSAVSMLAVQWAESTKGQRSVLPRL
jgi:DHA1 family bicyclomycin/chloramphenicol resistance-like MFS transporter